MIGYHYGRRSDFVDVDAEAGGQSRRDTEVDSGLDRNVGSQVRPARHECLQCGRRVIGVGLLLRRTGDEGFPYCSPPRSLQPAGSMVAAASGTAWAMRPKVHVMSPRAVARRWLGLRWSMATPASARSPGEAR